jgi:hypothetical protein
VDAAIHPEMYRRVDANGQRMPRGCNYPPVALSNSPEFQAINSKAIAEQLAINKWDACFDSLASARRRLKDAAEPDAWPKLPEEQRQVLAEAAKAISQCVSKVVRRRSECEAAKKAAEEQLRIMESDYWAKNPPPDDCRYSGYGVKAFEERFGT